MAKYILGLVTLFHPERFLGCSTHTLREHPHAIRYRKERTDRVKGASIPFGVQYLEDHAVIGNGVEVRTFRDTVVNGSSIVEFLADPRLLRIPDELPGRPKWRMEFRRQWPAADPPLTPPLLSTLRTRLSRSHLRVRGIWINPSIDLTWANTEWVNLVVGPCSQDAALRFRLAPLELRRDMAQQVAIELST